MKEEAPFLKVTSLTKQFGGVRAVDTVSFDLKKGEILGVIGPNGSGKTTLVNLITGFVKPDAGKVFYQGKDITGMMPHRIADLGIARAFQMVNRSEKNLRLSVLQMTILPVTMRPEEGII